MKNIFKVLFIVVLITVSVVDAFSRVREGEAVDDNVKRIIADHLKISISDISDTSTLKSLGADNVDAVLILTQAQYFFDIKYDEKDSVKLGKNTIKVSELIEKTIGKVYP